MTVYVDVVMLLNFLVDFLLLLGTNRICGHFSSLLRCAGSAALGGIYGGMCLVPGFSFLGSFFWRLVSLGVMGSIAFGINKHTLRRTVLFVFLAMALGGIAQGVHSGGFLGLVGCAAGVSLMCVLGFRGNIHGGKEVPVLLRKGDKRCRLKALRDTGNTLKDPITGQNVLVVGSEIAWEFLGLSQQQLLSPVETMAQMQIPGLRLIPYRSVGCSAGMLLGLHMDEVVIDGEKAGTLVAFAPQEIGNGETYQALAGGAI